MIERKLLRAPTEAINSTSIENANGSISNQIKHDVSKTIDSLFKPEQLQEQIEPRLLVKKKERKKKRGLHL